MVDSELFRCGWCGSPTHKEGNPLSMSQIGLTKDLKLWDNATLLTCINCNESIYEEDRYDTL